MATEDRNQAGSNRTPLRVAAHYDIIPRSTPHSGRGFRDRIVLDDRTMAALSGASSHHAAAHRPDCDCRRRRAFPPGPLAVGDPVGVLALVRRPLGGRGVPQLAAPAPPQRAWFPGCGSRGRVVPRRHGSRDRHASDRRGAHWAPAGALACVVARGGSPSSASNWSYIWFCSCAGAPTSITGADSALRSHTPPSPSD